MRYVIGDIHGCAKTLRAILEKLSVKTTDEVYFVGDLIDRGPDSKTVFEIVKDLHNKSGKAICCRGNHEQLLLDGIRDEFQLNRWLINGGVETLASFGTDSAKELPGDFMEFISGLPYYLEFQDALIVHAGFNFNTDNIFQDKEAMLWTREHVCFPERTGKRPVIHGHSPVMVDTCRANSDKGIRDINIDTGCVYKGHPGLGYLTAFCIDTGAFIHQPNIE